MTTYGSNFNGAEISPCGLYRYRLWRTLVIGHRPVITMAFVMLNPSTADATQDDPTIRRCAGFARREGCTRLEVVNLFAYRSPNPSDLRDALEAGIRIDGPDNLTHVTEVIEAAAFVVVGWGANVDRLPGSPVAHHLAYNRPLLQVHCLGVTKAGFPRHPLYVRGDQPLESWPR